LVAVVVIVILAATTMRWHQNVAAKQQTDQAVAKRQKPMADMAKNLPAEISTLEKQLDLPNKAAIDDNLKLVGAQVSVTVIDLSSKDRGQLHYNDTTQWTSASTYKLFVALEENQQVERGVLDWQSPLNGDTLSDCLDQMIVLSDNDCPVSWIQTYSSYSQLTATAATIGSHQTNLAADKMYTSGADLANLLERLQQGKLMNALDTKNLLDLMLQQRYRDGIPTGVQVNIGNGTTPTATSVSDKVGFINDYTGPILNDAALVRSPNGQYIVVIMTNGYSWQFIANLTTWIDAQME
jgi:beta-lactamase class A